MSLHYLTSDVGMAPTHPRSGAWSSDETVSPSTGAYLTDGTSLFRVADALSNRGELFLEIEDCGTLELILCPTRTLARLGLRPVVPALSV
jgi:hypothetical protein